MARSQKILIVEDNSDCRELLALLISRLGYEPIQAASGAEALRQAVELHPDLILMDLCMPTMSGAETTARLKATSATKDIPVIIVTAFSRSDFTDRALDSGAADILHKPFSLTTLRRLLDRYLSSGTSQENRCG